MGFILIWIGGFCIGMAIGIVLGREYFYPNKKQK
jgi:hypothetical protein